MKKDLLSFPKSLSGYKIESLEKDLKTKSGVFWQRRGETRALLLFKEMAKRVPAYKDFLKKNKIVPEKIKTIQDLEALPSVDKAEYLKKYPLEKLCWDGTLDTKDYIYASTSGTTGEPFYFPRSEAQDRQYALTAELYLRNNFQIHKKTSLYIDGFAMGAWIGGLFTYQAIRYVAEKGYSLSIITPGTNTPEILKAVKKLAPYYDQIIFGAYPPFAKDTIDAGIAEGINWKDYNIKFVFSAEGFTEKFRDYIADKVGLKNIYLDTLNHYGTVDQGTHSHETPLTILIRRIARDNPEFRKAIFGDIIRVPTLTQYLPELFYFDCKGEDLYCSAFSGLPLVRYDLKDKGGVMSYEEMLEKAKQAGVDLVKEIKKAKISDYVWKLPFVWLYERRDMVVSWYGANIYPEHIREALLHPELQKHVSGRFVMTIEHNDANDPELHIHTELRSGKNKLSKKEINFWQKYVVDTLLSKNAEYKNSYHSVKKEMVPKIKLWETKSAPYFHLGGKQRWVIKK